MLLTFISLVANANDHQDEALQLLRAADQQKKSYMIEAEQLRVQAINQIQQALQAEKLTSPTESCTKQNLTFFDEASPNKYLIFVSFSMPKATLQALYNDAKNQNAVLLLRGLKDGSFKSTAEYLRSLEISVQIDPSLFKKYQISRVPTIVALGENKFDSISGNISFGYAKEQLLRQKNE